MQQLRHTRQHWWWLLGVLLMLLYWLLPIEGTLLVSSVPLDVNPQWPQILLDPTTPRPGDEVTVTVVDNTPWTHVRLTVDHRPATFTAAQALPGGTTWQWAWRFTMPAPTAITPETRIEFYRDCATGCRLRGRRLLESLIAAQQSLPRPSGLPTKLCLNFPDPARDWHGRSGWVVDLTYTQLADATLDQYWSIDALAQRVALATAQGLRVLVRVDYAKDQSLPPTADALALTDYLSYLRRLARDERLRTVYGYIIGSGYNTAAANAQAEANPVTPTWYARLLNGAGESVQHTDNVIETIRSENPQVRILVGPVRPWYSDQSGVVRNAIDAPWLNYMNTLVAAVDAGSQAKAAAGIPLAAPDGFAVNAAGNPTAPELGNQDGASEPFQALPRPAWNGAQAGFRLYQDWLAIINRYPTTQGLPIYISATNTFASDATPDAPSTAALTPAQNYPPGWLTNALAVINQEPQVQALCWFLDHVPGDNTWDAFSLSQQPGRLIYAAEEFDALLRE
ncbi:MAG: hypothetical protein KF832_17565 [Caldilineaceae bacterium]|nr:hypothetical protein [Caldilineaceae bacterium]